jgi:hypothetical protein
LKSSTNITFLKNRQKIKIFTRTLAAFNDAYYILNRDVKKWFIGNLVSNFAKRYNDYRIKPSKYIMWVSVDGGFDKGETGVFRLIVSLAQLSAEFSRDAFDALATCRRSVMLDCPATSVHWVPLFVAKICRFYRESITLPAEEVERVVNVIVRELLYASVDKDLIFTRPLFEELGSVLQPGNKKLGEVQRAFEQLFSRTSDIGAITRSMYPVLQIIGDREMAKVWADRAIADAAQKVRSASSSQALEIGAITNAAAPVLALDDFVDFLVQTFEVPITKQELTQLRQS